MSAITCSLNLCFIPNLLLKKHKWISSINCFDGDLTYLMLKCLWDENKIQIWPTLLIIKMLDQQWMFCVSSHTLLIDVLWRQSMLQFNGCGHKSNA